MTRPEACALLLSMALLCSTLSMASGFNAQDEPHEVLRSRGMHELDRGNYAAAETNFLQAIALLRANNPVSLASAVLLSDLGDLYRTERRTSEAQQLYAESISILKLIPKTDAETAFELRQTGLVLHMRGLDREAERKYKESLAHTVRASGRDSLLYART